MHGCQAEITRTGQGESRDARFPMLSVSENRLERQSRSVDGQAPYPRKRTEGVRALATQGKDGSPVLDEPDEHDLLGEVAGRLGFRDRIRRSRGLNLAWRMGIGVVGGLVLLAGVVMIPYPGPGWLVVFAGLAILATEFTWAERVLGYAKHRYDGWNAWLRRQRPAVKAAVWLATAAIVVLTLWLLDAYELLGGWLGIEWTWLSSPIL
jgi:uncharacterized protein (TIGR02611 family)